ncbi:hypothetical protein RJ639_031372 [Escallonia herrerae]|uniref:AAA+ ATPase domain-containing protein n=1 Tax=Escallonia herrerae TaxID=1293975 RepID=A0AA88WYN4_9ASTE|nr:hypothetical protein RJ639_031372 [Escallonia herrerae]
MEESTGSTTNKNTTVSGSSSSKEWRAEEAIAGNSEALTALRELITFPLLYSRESQKLGLKHLTSEMCFSILCMSKLMLWMLDKLGSRHEQLLELRAVVRECDAHLTIISPHSVHRAHAGESEKILREAFAEAASHAKLGKPSVIFIDEIDALCPRRDSRREQDIRVTSQLFTLMDSNRPGSTSIPQIVVVASTNRVDSIDPALRRSGRFDSEIEVTTPCEEERLHILQLYTKKLPLDHTVDLEAVAASCNGYVGADLEALCREATMCAVRKVPDETHETGVCSLSVDDWNHAKSVVGPSITRGVTVEIPKVSWDDIGGLQDLKKKLQQAVEWPLKHAAAFARLGVSPVRGVLLHGPPGCSKTTLAKAAAHAAQASFFSLSGAELYSMYVGEGEALLRNTFRRARLAAPSIIFFDEADVVAAKRGGSSSGSTTVGERLLSTLLTEMDGLEQAKVLYVPPPDLEARYEILSVHTRGMKVGTDVDMRQLAEDTELFTGAELEGLCREAGIVALREDISATVVCDRHFQTVKNSLKPALTREEIDSYSSFMKNPSLRSSSRHESSAKQKSNHTKNSWGSVAPVTIGVVSFILLAAVKYYLKHVEQVPSSLAST